MLKEYELELKLYNILGDFANYLNELAITHRLFSAATASAFIYAIQGEIKSEKFEEKFQTALSLVLKIEMEHKSIVETPFYKIIQNLYQEERKDWNQILSLLTKALATKVELENIVSPVAILKQYVQIGRSNKPEHGNDIVFPDDKTLSRIHLVVSVENNQFYIEDRSANGTFLNGKKIEKGVKVAVSVEDKICIGREETLVDLTHPKIAALLS